MTLFKSEEEQPVGTYLCACATIHACYLKFNGHLLSGMHGFQS